MSYNFHVPDFRVAYQETIDCKDDINNNAFKAYKANNLHNWITELIQKHSLENVEKVIATTISFDYNKNLESNYHIWADNIPKVRYLYETPDVESLYQAKNLNLDIIKSIAIDLMERDKNKKILYSKDNTELEILQQKEDLSLIKYYDTSRISNVFAILKNAVQTNNPTDVKYDKCYAIGFHYSEVNKMFEQINNKIFTDANDENLNNDDEDELDI